MRGFLTPALLVLALSGCSSTGPVPTGRDTYMIAKTSPACGFRSASGTKAAIYQEANTFCQSQGKVFQSIGTDETDGIVGRRCASAEINFRCLAADDPAYTRPGFERQSDIVIETRER